VYAKNFIIDDCCKGQVVKNGGAVAPHVGRPILAKALIVEAINLGDLSALVVSPDKSDSFRISDLQGQQQQESFYTVISSVNKISHEKIIGVRALTTHLEKLL